MQSFALDRPDRSAAASLLAYETRALLTRLDRIKPFVLYETMVLAAAPPLQAQVAIERYLAEGRRQLRELAAAYLRWLNSPEARYVPASELQRRFTIIRLRFNLMLSQFDIFADVITQRSEHGNGVWLAGLDDLAADALALPGGYFDPPPVICYLDRGHGAAIRRARTRLPGGGESPVAVIQVPRERMISSGIASSLVHEVGHQAAALLGLVESLNPVLRDRSCGACLDGLAWRFWARWISEIVADLWSVARVGVASTQGLMAVVSLPRPFVFRVGLDDPHPAPWIRVRLSAALGAALYPDPQWGRLSEIWEALYPRTGLSVEQQTVFAALERTMPAFVRMLMDHRLRSLAGKSLFEALADPVRQPVRLRDRYMEWNGSRAQMRATPPSLVFAAIGQARADGRLSPELESRVLGDLLTDWAMSSALDASEYCTYLETTRIKENTYAF